MKRTLSTTIRYFWGNDLSGTEQGAGNAPVAKRTRRAARGRASVASSPCPSMGRSSSPCYDHNGNIVCYVSETGVIAGQYVYDPYGNVFTIDAEGTVGVEKFNRRVARPVGGTAFGSEIP